MRVRPATHADLSAILDIYNDAILHTTATADYEPHTLEMRMEWFESRVENGYPVFVAEDETGQVVGWSSLSPYHPRIGYRFSAEVSVYVAANSRGKGVGKSLLPPLIEAARACGLHSLIASIDSANEASIRLHTAFGFQRAGQLDEVIYKFDQWLGVVYMQLLLSAEEQTGV